MLKRRTVLAIAKLATSCFEYMSFPGSGLVPQHNVRPDWFSELLFEKEHDMVLVETARALHQSDAIKNFILSMYSGLALELLTASRQQAAGPLPPIDRSALAKELEMLARENNLDVGNRVDVVEAEFQKAKQELTSLR